jgi:Zn-dependent protease with chaperone function
LLYSLCLIAQFCTALYVFGWRHHAFLAVARFGSLALFELVSVAPFLLAVAVSWLPGHMMGSVLRAERRSFRHHIGFQARGVAVSIFPWFIFLTVLDLTRFLPDRAQELMYLYPFLHWVTAIGLLGGLFVIAPWLLRIVWAPRSMPDGELRRRLDAFCRRMGFKCRDILVWKTAGGVVNAGVTGIIAPLRYILITDAMLEALPPEEIEAVLAHEIGHAVHLHIPWYAVLSLGYVSVMMTGWSLVLTGLGDAIGTVAMLAFFAFYWVVLFGFVSRRLERQADLFSARAMGDFGLVARALERVAVLNGHVQKVFSLRHFSIARRVRFLLRARQDPETAARTERRLTGTLAVLGLVVLVGLGGAARIVAEQIHDPSSQYARLAQRALARRDYDAARRYALGAVESSPSSDPHHHVLLGDCYLAVADRSRALSEYRTALHLAGGSGRLGRDLAKAIRSLSPEGT